MVTGPSSIAVVDYGMGNLFSVRNALTFLGAEVRIVSSPGDLAGADAVILPGVGAFGEAMDNLTRRGFVRPLTDAVVADGMPFLGICLGMQLLARQSPEMGDHKGLGWLNAEVEMIRMAPGIRIPHVSWNRLAIRQDSRIFERIKFSDTFYFDHSFQFTAFSEGVIAYTDYHGIVPSVVERDNIFATQFHPEKSQRSGLILLRNFLNIVEDRRKAA